MSAGASWGAAIGPWGLCLAHLGGPARRAAIAAAVTATQRLDVRGCILPAHVISEITAQRPIPRLDASHAVFEGPVNLPDTDLHDLEITGASFMGPVDFSRARFHGGLYLDDVTFEGPALFTGATFKGPVSITDTWFHGPARFTHAAFRGRAHFSDVEFWRTARFQHTRFRRGVTFDEVAFSRRADFTRVRCHADFRFRATFFQGPAIFDKARLTGAVAFTIAAWYYELHTDPLTGANWRHWPPSPAFLPDDIFNHFQDRTSFRKATITSPTDFTGALFNYHMPDFTGANLNGVVLDPYHALAGWKPLPALPTRLLSRLDPDRTRYLAHTTSGGLTTLIRGLEGTYNTRGARYVTRIHDARWPRYR